MGFYMGQYNSNINKVRIPLSKRARITISEDMSVFQVKCISTFINMVLWNYKDDAKFSIRNYLDNRRDKLETILSYNEELEDEAKKIAIDEFLKYEENELKNEVSVFEKNKGESKLYSINKRNFEFLESKGCKEDKEFECVGQYIRCVVEEYCSLPFIQRERIYRKDVFDIVERACRERKEIKVQALYNSELQTFCVNPYKILPDQLHTRSYLACYSRRYGENKNEQKIASFAMSRIIKVDSTNKDAFLSKDDIKQLENMLTKNSVAYLIGKPESIKIKLTEKGKQMYRIKLFSRPERIAELSTEDVYAFDCTQQQAFNFFFSFGSDAEILEPNELKERFMSAYKNACKSYGACISDGKEQAVCLTD